MRRAHGCCCFVVFDALTLAAGRLVAFYDYPNALRDYFCVNGCGDHRDLHGRGRRQRQVCIRDRRDALASRVVAVGHDPREE